MFAGLAGTLFASALVLIVFWSSSPKCLDDPQRLRRYLLVTSWYALASTVAGVIRLISSG